MLLTQQDIARKARVALIVRAAGVDHNPKPGDSFFRRWWVYGPGRKRWNTWTELYTQLLEHMTPARARLAASAWFRLRFGFASGSDLNRVRQGKPPRGKRIGKG